MFSMMKLVVTIFLAVIISAIKADNANLISLNSPAANQMLVPNEQVALQYTIIGVTKSSMNPKTALVPNYPSSLDVYFRWTSNKNNTEQPISLTAASGLSTTPFAGGARDKTYTYHWKLPNCHFFKRYLPSDWSFTLVFESQYPETTASRTVSSNKNSTTIEPLGPEQTAITIPISINLNSTASDDHHPKHKGC